MFKNFIKKFDIKYQDSMIEKIFETETNILLSQNGLIPYLGEEEVQVLFVHNKIKIFVFNDDPRLKEYKNWIEEKA